MTIGLLSAIPQVCTIVGMIWWSKRSDRHNERKLHTLLPYLFAALAVSPLTVIELIFGSKRYFLRIQIEQLLIIIVAFIALPELGQRYEIALLTFSVLTSIRYLFILLKMNKRALQLSRQEQKICS